MKVKTKTIKEEAPCVVCGRQLVLMLVTPPDNWHPVCEYPDCNSYSMLPIYRAMEDLPFKKRALESRLEGSDE